MFYTEVTKSCWNRWYNRIPTNQDLLYHFPKVIVPELSGECFNSFAPFSPCCLPALSQFCLLYDCNPQLYSLALLSHLWEFVAFKVTLSLVPVCTAEHNPGAFKTTSVVALLSFEHCLEQLVKIKQPKWSQLFSASPLVRGTTLPITESDVFTRHFLYHHPEQTLANVIQI